MAVSSETMARTIVNGSHVASPASITAMAGDHMPDELFLPPRYGLAARDVAAPSSSGSLFDLAAKQEAALSLLKTDQALVRQALCKVPSLKSLVGAPPSLREVFYADEDDVDDEDDADDEDVRDELAE